MNKIPFLALCLLMSLTSYSSDELSPSNNLPLIPSWSEKALMNFHRTLQCDPGENTQAKTLREAIKDGESMQHCIENHIQMINHPSSDFTCFFNRALHIPMQSNVDDSIHTPCEDVLNMCHKILQKDKEANTGWLAYFGMPTSNIKNSSARQDLAFCSQNKFNPAGSTGCNFMLNPDLTRDDKIKIQAALTLFGYNNGNAFIPQEVVPCYNQKEEITYDSYPVQKYDPVQKIVYSVSFRGGTWLTPEKDNPEDTSPHGPWFSKSGIQLDKPVEKKIDSEVDVYQITNTPPEKDENCVYSYFRERKNGEIKRQYIVNLGPPYLFADNEASEIEGL